MMTMKMRWAGLLALGWLVGAWAQTAETAAPAAPELPPLVAPPIAESAPGADLVVPEPGSAAWLLAAARRPFLEPEWCRLKGEIQYRGPKGKFSGPLTLSMLMDPSQLEAELLLGTDQLSRVMQTYRPDPALPEVKLTLPTVPKGVLTLREMGVEPDDLTFSFLYWKLAQELPPESVRGQGCRVMELVHPQRLEKVRAWMHEKHAFPLRIQWFLPGEPLYNRQLEFSDFKRKDDFWYPTGIRMQGPDWTTRIQFDEVEIAKRTETPAPVDLFRTP